MSRCAALALSCWAAESLLSLLFLAQEQEIGSANKTWLSLKAVQSTTTKPLGWPWSIILSLIYFKIVSLYTGGISVNCSEI